VPCARSDGVREGGVGSMYGQGGGRGGTHRRNRLSAQARIARPSTVVMRITCSALQRLRLCLMLRQSSKVPSPSSSRRVACHDRPACCLLSAVLCFAMRGGGGRCNACAVSHVQPQGGRQGRVIAEWLVLRAPIPAPASASASLRPAWRWRSGLKAGPHPLRCCGMYACA
jgi:hypothetical protein